MNSNSLGFVTEWFGLGMIINFGYCFSYYPCTLDLTISEVTDDKFNLYLTFRYHY